MRAAGPARLTVDHHRARTAHPDTASKAITESWICLLLNPRDDIEDRLAFVPRDVEGLISPAARVSPPDRNVEVLIGCRHFVRPC